MVFSDEIQGFPIMFPLKQSIETWIDLIYIYIYIKYIILKHDFIMIYHDETLSLYW